MNKVLFLSLFFLLGCNVTQNIIIKEFDMSLKEEANDETEREFLEIAPKNLHKQKNQALIFLISYSFYKDTVLINKKDTLIFNKKLPNDCGLRPYVINKKGKYFRISTNKNKEIKIRNIDKYNYVVIKKFIDGWQVSYYPFFPIIKCY